MEHFAGLDVSVKEARVFEPIRGNFCIFTGYWGIWRPTADDRSGKRIGRRSTGSLTGVFWQLPSQLPRCNSLVRV